MPHPSRLYRRLPAGILLLTLLGATTGARDARDATVEKVAPGAEGSSPGSRDRPSSWWLGALPEGVEKRKFILDCTGCHQFNETRVFTGDSLRTERRWSEDVARMLRYAGASSGFPVIAADRDSTATASWLASHLTPAAVAPRARAWSLPADRLDPSRTRVTEFDLPEARDLPHDLAVDESGRVLVTGMFTHVIYTLEPGARTFGSVPIPVPNANPRAIEIDGTGDWWVLLGQPKRIARYRPAAGTWDSWEIGLYPHSVAVSGDRKSVWFNGHFTRDPEEIGRLDVGAGKVERFTVPPHPTLARAGGPVPYEQRLAPDGTVWMSELQGNRIVSYEPARGRFRAYDMPSPWSGPRRFDIAADGTLWIPAYSGNALVRFDPKSGVFREFPLPVSDTLPYIARVHPRTGEVWIGTAAADAVFRFTPETERFASCPLPTRGATIRHMAFDPRNGELWLAYGASPALHPARIARVEVAGPR